LNGPRALTTLFADNEVPTPNSDAQYSYRELGPLAEGGMARLTLANRSDGQTVVIKRIRHSFQHEQVYRGLFRDECAVAQLLRHPNIVCLLDHGEDQDGLYMVFEHIDGTDLSIVLERTVTSGNGLELGPFFALFIPFFSALNATHKATGDDGQMLGLIHRDISPGNILLSEQGDLKLADFGVAKSSLKTQDTVAGELKGKFAYMAPEQTRGDTLDFRADLFSAGAVMYECLSGQSPFDAPTDADTVHAVREKAHSPLIQIRDDLPAPLTELIDTLLQKDSSLRPDSALAVHDSLRQIASDLCLEQGLQRHITYLAKSNPRPKLKSSDEETAPQAKRHTQRVVGLSSQLPTPQQRPRGLWQALAVAVIIIGVAALWVSFSPNRSFTEKDGPGLNAAPSENVMRPSTARGASPDLAVKSESVVTARGSPSDLSEGAIPDPKPGEPKSSKRIVPTTVKDPTTRTAGPTKSKKLPPRTKMTSGSTSTTQGKTKTKKEAGYGRLFLSSDPWAEVSIDGVEVGAHTPLLGLRLKSGPHEIRMRNPHYNIEKKIQVVIPKGGDVRRYIDLSK
jgi:eukaryotic-like serine/threonine-protein kinase